MVDQLSPLQPVYRPGAHGNFGNGVGVYLSETQPGSIVQVAAWPGQTQALIAAIGAATGLVVADAPRAGAFTSEKSAFGMAAGTFLVADQAEGLATTLLGHVTGAIGTVTDLSHGRTALRVEGPKAEWVLSKFFAIDFSSATFPIGEGRSTSHHDVFAQIQRTSEDRFDVYVFRSLARSFWTSLCHASEEVGYEVR